MLLPFSLLQLVELFLPLSVCVRATLAADSIFTFHAHGTGVKAATGSGSLSADNIGVTTSDDLSYTVEITLGGENFTVLLDTGSTDLWVNTVGRNVRLTNTTDLPTGITYGKGVIEGQIAFAELTIGDFTLESQAFINPTRITDLETTTFDGIIGMAFDVANVYSTVQQAWGTEAADALARSPITSLFAKHPELSNNFDVELARTSELDDIADGAFVISGHAPGFEAVTQAPQLPRVHSAHWSVVMDAMHVNGQAVPFNKSRIVGVPDGKIVSAWDTGFSFPPLPPGPVDAIYGSIPGAEFDPVAGFWIVPCNASTNLTFTFGGVEYPIHPVDLTFPLVTAIPINGQLQNVTTCLNTYQYLTLDASVFEGFDIILGDAFLRNVYASFDYGDYYPTNRTNGLPFIQAVSTTDTATMWEEFYAERAAALADLPPEVPPRTIVEYDRQVAQTSSTGTGAVGAAEDDEDGVFGSGGSWGRKYGKLALGLLAANLLIGVALLGVTITMCVRGMKGRAGPRYTPVRFKDESGETGAFHKYGD